MASILLGDRLAGFTFQIAQYPDDCPIGQIRFDLEDKRPNRREITIEISVDTCALRHGISLQLVSTGLAKAKLLWGDDCFFVAEVLSENAASNTCFARCGFETDLSYNTRQISYKSVNHWALGSE